MLIGVLLAISAVTAPAGETERTSVGVLPLAVQGELPERWLAEAQAKLVSGMSRGTLAVRGTDAHASCRTRRCWAEDSTLSTSDFVVAASLTVGDERDYRVSIDVMSAGTGKVVASNSGVCELCGFEEAVAMIEARAAVLSPEVARLGAVLPVLLFRSDPPGVRVTLDGRAYGTTPLRVQAPAGPHRIEASKDGYVPQSFQIESVDGVRKEVELRLVPTPSGPLPPGRGLVIAGAVSTGVGVAVAAVGITFLGLDGRPFRSRCNPDAAGVCQFEYETTVGGAIATGVGAAALAAGVGMLATGLVRGKRASRATPSDASAQRVRLLPGRIGLRF